MSNDNTWVMPYDPTFPEFIKTLKDSGENGLYSYQQYVVSMFKKDTPYRGILLYHGLGVGKTRTAINIADSLGRKTIVLLPAFLQANFKKEIVAANSNLKPTYINYNGIQKKHATEMQNNRIFDGTTVIIDETHNFISGVKNNSNILKTIYKMITTNEDIKVICLTGTPIINNPIELAYIFNMIHGNIIRYKTKEIGFENNKRVFDVNHDKSTPTFCLHPMKYEKVENGSIGMIKKSKKAIAPPEDTTTSKSLTYKLIPTNESEFEKLFIENETLINTSLFSRRIQGLVSYYEYFNQDNFADRSEINIVECPMSANQLTNYTNMRAIEIENEERQKKKRRNKKHDTDSDSSESSTSKNNKESELYRAYTRAISNFAFPPGIKRQYTSLMKHAYNDIDDDAIDTPSPNDDLEIPDLPKMNAVTYKKEIASSLNQLDNSPYLDINKLEECSPKMYSIYNTIVKSKGPAMVYSSFRNVEGLKIFSMVLKHQGYIEFKIKKKGTDWFIDCSPSDLDKPKYIVFENTKDKDEINILLSIFNSDIENIPDTIRNELPKKFNNLYGDFIKCIMITKSGSEGISLKNVRQVHLMEPYWNTLRIKQVIGRAIRANSHSKLKKEDRKVDIYLYLATFPAGLKKNKLIEPRTTDQYIYSVAQRKEHINNQFLDLLKQSAIDCPKHKRLHNIKSCMKHPVNNRMVYKLDDISKESLKTSSVLSMKPVKGKNKNGDVIHVKRNGKKLYYDENYDIYDEDVQLVGKFENKKPVYY